MTSPELSIIVLSWNTRELTEACLDALPAAVGPGCAYETIVVDNGSHDGSGEALAARGDVRLVRNPANRGFAAAVNQGYRLARGEYVLLLNSDAELPPGALTHLLSFLRSRPDAAGVSPRYVNPDGSPQRHLYRLPDFPTAVGLVSALRALPPVARRLRDHAFDGADLPSPRPVEQPSASCLLLRRAALPPGPLLDERYPVFFNDVDLAQRLAQAGRSLWVVPDVVVVHELGASTRLLGPQLARHYLGSLVRYVRSHMPRRRSLPLQALVLAAGAARRLARRPGALPIGELVRAARGDVGPLAQPAGGSGDEPWVVFMSAIRWDWHRNRQQELALQLARRRRVLFVEAPGLRPSWRLRVEPVAPRVWRATQPALLPLGRFVDPANRLNRRYAAWRLRRWLGQRPGERLLWIDEDLAAPLAGRLGERARVYDVTDLDWTFTRRWNRGHLRRALGHAVAAADLVLVSSRALVTHLPVDRRRVEPLLNACDPAHFELAGATLRPAADRRSPVVGYVGAIDERAFDAELVADVARRRPDWCFALAGPVRGAAAEPLRGLPNVELLGPRAYGELPRLLQGFDVCLIPYRAHGLVDYVHPKKLYEYLAAGKPVVATPLPALEDIAAPVHLANGTEAFVAAIQAALADARSPGFARAARACAHENSWDRRGCRLHTLLDGLERRKRDAA